MISQTAEYALRAMVVLLTGDPQEFSASQDIAARAQVPADYMSKILHALVRAGLVTSQRGRNGGCKASRDGSQISVLDVVQAVDPIRRILTCPLGLKSHGTHLCPLHRKLDDAVRMVEEAFGSTTLSDLLATPSPSKPLCEKGDMYHVQATSA